MNKLVSPLLLIMVTLCLGACASKPKPSQGVQKTFTTDILENGSKRFVVAIVNAQTPRDSSKNSKHSGKRGDGGGPKDGGKRKGQGRPESNSSSYGLPQNSNGSLDEDKREEIMALLNEKIAQTGYCRHGFIELDYSQMREKTELVGECQESASSQDKERWD